MSELLQLITGALLLDEEKGRILRFEVDGANTSESEDWDQKPENEIVYHPSFAHENVHVGDVFVSPFLQAMRRRNRGGGTSRDAVALLSWLNAVKNDVGDLRRIIRNFETGNWSQFEIGVR